MKNQWFSILSEKDKKNWKWHHIKWEILLAIIVMISSAFFYFTTLFVSQNNQTIGYILIATVWINFVVFSLISWVKYKSISKSVKIKSDGFYIKYLNNKEEFIRWGEIEEIITQSFSVLDRNFYIFYRHRKFKRGFLSKIRKFSSLDGGRKCVLLPNWIGDDISTEWKKYLEGGGEYVCKNKVRDLIKTNKRMILEGVLLAIINPIIIWYMPWSQLFPKETLYVKIVIFLLIAGVLFPIIFAFLGWAAKDNNQNLMEKIKKIEKNPLNNIE